LRKNKVKESNVSIEIFRATIRRSDSLNLVILLSLKSEKEISREDGNLVAEVLAVDLEKKSSVAYNKAKI